jgi:MFS family permease
MLHNMQRFAPVSLFEELRKAWGSSYTGMGTVFGAYLMAYAACLVPMGMIADRVDNKHLMITGIIVNMAGSILFALSPNLNIAILARLALGVSGSMLYVPTVRYVVTTFAREKRGSTMGFVELGVGLGSMLALVILPSATATLGLTSAYLIPVAVAAVLLIGITLGVKSTRSARKGPSQALLIFRSYIFWSFLIFSFLGLYASYSVSGWLPTFLRRNFQSTATEAGAISALNSANLMFFSPIAGAISDRIGARKPVMFAGLAIYITALSTLILSHDIRLVMVAASLMGCGGAFTIPVAIMFAGETFADAGIGLAVALTAATQQIASSLSGPVSGYTLDLTGSFFSIWVIALSFSVLRIPLLMSIGERRAERDRKLAPKPITR